MGRYPAITQLADSVLQMCEHTPEDDSFLPNHKFSELVTPTTVQSAFQNTGLSGATDLADFALHGGKCLFLILVMMSDETEKISHLRELRNDGVSDASLPIGFKAGQNYGYPLEARNGTKFLVFQTWTRHDRDLFETYQPRFISPVFGNSKFRFNFASRRILPYLGVDKKPSNSGFFGEVSRIEIHPAHAPNLQPNPKTKKVEIAVKRAKDNEGFAHFFDKEADNLEKLREYKSPHLITPIAAYQIKEDRCLIFPWASGGNLGEFWIAYDGRSPDLQWIIRQLLGICSALKELHHSNCRHGDLKPENILWFKDEFGLGTLQIADLGLARFHEEGVHTNIRQNNNMQTLTPSGTSRYEPPETDKDRATKAARSRQYDIWSMGCIILELLIWLMYGYPNVEKFRANTKYFWDRQGGNQYSVHHYVVERMKNMDKELPNDTAYKELLQLVRDRLLIVKVSETYGSQPDSREIAEVLHRSIMNIQSKCESKEGYLEHIRRDYSIGENASNVPKPGIVYQHEGGLAVPPRMHVPKTLQTPRAPRQEEEDISLPVLVRIPTDPPSGLDSSPTGRQVPRISDGQEYYNMIEPSKQLLDVWESSPDNQLAVKLFESVKWDRSKPAGNINGVHLCHTCKAIDHTHLFQAELDVSKVNKCPKCDLCALLYKALKRENQTGVIKLSQNGATVRVENGPALLSIYVEPGSILPPEGQLGLPWLLEQGSQEQFTLLKEWIRACDEDHSKCRREFPEQLSMPTRLIEVGESLRLVESASLPAASYIALSHCWGSLNDDQKFCTMKGNIEELKTGIAIDSLPCNFKDAVTVTRGLGIKYIWIDSLCIIQDDEGDWERESGKMERVFSDAYYTIAASSAKSSLEGFLGNRASRECVQFETQSMGTLYICPFIDDFHGHVELGALNRRGWVLQERALSRRSIYFTSTQVYWECGEGVRCETLARLHNSKAALLGDANFPKSALEYYRDGRQVLIQDLYERYSALAFTKPSDRPVAILGLQHRLARAFKTQAAYGCFELYFGRGILWTRRGVEPQKRLDLPTGRHVPTWSWFSIEGPIKYMDLKFKQIEWATPEDFETPFVCPLTAEARRLSECCLEKEIGILRGVARKLNMTESEITNYIIFDEGEPNQDDLRCVVIGRDKTEYDGENPKFHVLIIQHVENFLGKDIDADIYERVGVASVRPEHVDREGLWVSIM